MGKIQRVHVHEMVAKEIQNYIRDKDLKDGDKLPSAEELAKMFGVGRSSLREALRYLETVEVVRVENGKGIFVRDVDLFRFTGKIKLDHEKQYLLNVLDVRRALEGKAVELAAKNASAKQIEELGACIEEYKRLKALGKETSQIDLAFHRMIIVAAGNDILESVLNSISEIYRKFFEEPLGEKRLFDETYPFHLTMYEAIAAHNAEKALSEFNGMMDCVERLIKTYQ